MHFGSANRYSPRVQAKFITIGNFTIPSRNLFVVVGDIIEGDINPGAIVQVESASNPEAPIVGVELVEASFRSQACWGLVFSADNLDRLALPRELSAANETLVLTKAAA